MREIKFRAWDTNKKEMFVPQRILYSSDDEIFLIDKNGKNRGSRCTLMQYTGLKDKNGNGKEIYEGDVVRYFTCENEKGEVWLYKPGYPVPLSWLAEITFKDGAFGVKNSIFEGKKGATWSVEGTKHQPNQRNWEVIGNIYQNPELIEK